MAVALLTIDTILGLYLEWLLMDPKTHMRIDLKKDRKPLGIEQMQLNRNTSLYGAVPMNRGLHTHFAGMIPLPQLRGSQGSNNSLSTHDSTTYSNARSITTNSSHATTTWGSFFQGGAGGDDGGSDGMGGGGGSNNSVLSTGSNEVSQFFNVPADLGGSEGSGDHTVLLRVVVVAKHRPKVFVL